MPLCVVIGGNGFIGSHLVDALAERGHQVRVFDRFSGGAEYYEARGVHRVVGDFLNTEDMRSAVAGAEYVFHMLSTTTPLSAQRDPLIDIRTNVTASVDLLEACATAGVRHLFFASTGGAIYGNSSQTPVTEATPPAPISPYAIGKLTVEGYMRYFRVERSLPSTALRISNPYGPRQHPGRKQGVIPIFLEHVRRSETLTVFGDGSMVRDYVFVKDVARLISAMVDREPQFDTYNIGSGEGHSIIEILAAIAKTVGFAPTVNHVPQPATFVGSVILDPSRYLEEYPLTAPLTSLADGLEETWRDVAAHE